MTWEETLSYGKEVEHFVLSKIQDKYPKAFIKDGRHSPWDIYVPEIKMKIEVKSDVMSNKTGNIVIETSFGAKPSAISTTTAHYWVFFDRHFLIWITPDHIQDAIAESKAELKRFVGGSDKKEKTAYLVPKQLIIKHADFIDKLEYVPKELMGNESE